MEAPDRRQVLIAQNRVTGIDFIYVEEDQIHLRVYFLRPPDTLVDQNGDPDSLVNDLDKEQIRIYNPTGETSLPEIPVESISWVLAGGEHVLHLTTALPGDFSFYRLQIEDSRIDRYFNNLKFTFKANCPSDLDCKPAEHECPPEEMIDFPVDYLARDFDSFRRALSEFAFLRYPKWKDRLVADAGIMLLEAMSALGDEMAYYQDRIGREAYLETAGQRRSVRRHARLVDYIVHDGLGATTWLDVTVKDGLPDPVQFIPAGADMWAMSDTEKEVKFEIGLGLEESIAGKAYRVDYRRNEFNVHCWDEDDVCLPIGATELFLFGHHAGVLAPADEAPVEWVLLKTKPFPSRPSKTHLVRLAEIDDMEDAVLGLPITRLRWESAQALPFEMDMSILNVRANLLPITAGEKRSAHFITGEEPDLIPVPETVYRFIDRAVERVGSNNAVSYLYTLPGSEDLLLVWLGADPRKAKPEIHLREVAYDGTNWVPANVPSWSPKRSFFDHPSSKSFNRHFSLEDGAWRRVVGYRRDGAEIIHKDYASSDGTTIRFGDGEFGLIPDEGSVFQVDYRLGNGQKSNISAGAITHFHTSLDAFVEAVDNPFPVLNGMDTEPLSEVKKLAPEAFRAVAYRAVRPVDYAEAAERLPWVQKAGAVFRWTGSWLSAFVTPDPLGTVVLEPARRQELVNQLDRFRQAGREAHVLGPIYANLDLEIHICVASEAFKGEVKTSVLEALTGKKGIRPKKGYFSPDNFTFGDTLNRSSLEAAIQRTPGVRAVEKIRIRRRHWFDWKLFSDASYDPGKQAIIRVQNNPLFPERGSINLIMNGGA